MTECSDVELFDILLDAGINNGVKRKNENIFVFGNRFAK